ncbi:unnamed protein product [Brassicogethes aeneus]|uniref:RING-type E3 ubiquitin transferase n=1 Tax=Brassicogethes aeneus TaxID=1431903 RepID=A0A9P0F8G1_BRAAE|nr:unnamed protein product [Brassicogethes aeneus]
MANETMIQFTDDLLEAKIFHCQICDELCTSDIFLVKGKGNVCVNCIEDKCGEEIKSRAELNTALVLILKKLMLLPCKFQYKGCNKRVPSNNYHKHVASCKYKIKSCPMVNYEECKWNGSNSEISEHIRKEHKEHIIKSEYNIFIVDTSLVEPSVKLFFDGQKNYLLNTSVVDNKFYYALSPIDHFEENVEYIVKHRSTQTPNNTFVKTDGTITQLNGIYNERCLDKNPNATGVDIGILEKIAGENMVRNEFNLHPGEIDKHTLKLLECPVCMNIMRPPIYNCTKGHSICHFCCEKVRYCPTCEGEWTNSRNYLIENLMAKVKYPCKFDGCKEEDFVDGIKKHEETCSFFIYQCPMGCTNSGDYNFILEHLNSEHKSMEYEKFSEISYTRFKKETQKWTLFDSKLFRISYYYFDESMNWQVELICSSDNPNMYKYRVVITNYPDIENWELAKHSICLEERKPFRKSTEGIRFKYYDKLSFTVIIGR